MHWTTLTGAAWEFFANRFLSRRQFERRRLVKFRKLVAYASQRSPYYQRIIREQGIDPRTCRPEDFPVLSKQTFIDHFDEIVTDPALTKQRVSDFLATSHDPAELLDDRYVVVHTSGTSGTIAYYVYSLAEWDRSHLLFIRFQGLPCGRRIAHVAAMNGHFHGAVMTRLAQQGFRRWFCRVERFDVNDPAEKVIQRLNAFQPSMVSGYGVALKMLAELQQAGELKINPRALYYGGEPLSGEDRQFVRGTFDAPVYSVYATSEHLLMGATQHQSDLMMLFEDDLIFEFQPDHVRVTNLFNYTMPLIRYRLNDVLTPVGIASQGHPFTLVKDLVGRSEQLVELTNRDGKRDFIHPIVIAEFFVKHLRAFQLVLVNETRFIFRAQVEPSLSLQQRASVDDQIQRKLWQILSQKNMDNVRFSIEHVDRVPIDKRTGKFRLIIRPNDFLDGLSAQGSEAAARAIQGAIDPEPKNLLA